MSITVELTYDMSKELGTQRFEVENVSTVSDAVRRTKERFGDAGDRFELLTRVASVAVNGVLINHRKGMKTRLAEGDIVTFLKPAAGG